MHYKSTPEYDINTYVGSLIDDIHSSLKANHALHWDSNGNKHKLSMRHVRARSRSIGARLNDLPVIYSGFATEAALIQKYNFNTRWCVEHQYPRQVAGYDLYYWSIEQPLYDDTCFDELVVRLNDCRTINFTTKEENQRLFKFQGYGTFESPEKAYEKADVKLIPWPKNTKINKLPEIHPFLLPLLKEK